VIIRRLAPGGGSRVLPSACLDQLGVGHLQSSDVGVAVGRFVGRRQPVDALSSSRRLVALTVLSISQSITEIRTDHVRYMPGREEHVPGGLVVLGGAVGVDAVGPDLWLAGRSDRAQPPDRLLAQIGQFGGSERHGSQFLPAFAAAGSRR
jgi:hypothetical protein